MNTPINETNHSGWIGDGNWAPRWSPNIDDVCLGVRKLVSRRTALTTTYGYSVMFADGQHIKRHQVTAGVSVFFR